MLEGPSPPTHLVDSASSFATPAVSRGKLSFVIVSVPSDFFQVPAQYPLSIMAQETVYTHSAAQRSTAQHRMIQARSGAEIRSELVH